MPLASTFTVRTAKPIRLNCEIFLGVKMYAGMEFLIWTYYSSLYLLILLKHFFNSCSIFLLDLLLFFIVL